MRARGAWRRRHRTLLDVVDAPENQPEMVRMPMSPCRLATYASDLLRALARR